MSLRFRRRLKLQSRFRTAWRQRRPARPAPGREPPPHVRQRGNSGAGLYAVRHFKCGEDHEVTGLASPFLIGVLIAIMIIGIAAGAGR